MNKLELISALKQKSGLTKTEAADVVETFFDSLTTALARGERVEIRGLCSFFIKKYDMYILTWCILYAIIYITYCITNCISSRKGAF